MLLEIVNENYLIVYAAIVTVLAIHFASQKYFLEFENVTQRNKISEQRSQISEKGEIITKKKEKIEKLKETVEELKKEVKKLEASQNKTQARGTLENIFKLIEIMEKAANIKNLLDC